MYPGAAAHRLEGVTSATGRERAATASELRQWPIRLRLLNPAAGDFDEVDLLVAADCAPFAYANFHGSFFADRILIIFCPEPDRDIEEYVGKLTEILSRPAILSITVIRMGVSCCGGVRSVADRAVGQSGRQIPVVERTITMRGELA